MNLLVDVILPAYIVLTTVRRSYVNVFTKGKDASIHTGQLVVVIRPTAKFRARV